MPSFDNITVELFYKKNVNLLNQLNEHFNAEILNQANIDDHLADTFDVVTAGRVRDLPLPDYDMIFLMLVTLIMFWFNSRGCRIFQRRIFQRRIFQQ